MISVRTNRYLSAVLGALLGSLGLLGCAADVGPNDPGGGSTVLVGGHTGGPGGDGTGSGNTGGGDTSGNIRIGPAGQPNGIHDQGSPNEGPLPVPWLGGAGGGQSNQSPDNHGMSHARSAMESTH
jgi:hypothetical protein